MFVDATAATAAAEAAAADEEFSLDPGFLIGLLRQLMPSQPAAAAPSQTSQPAAATGDAVPSEACTTTTPTAAGPDCPAEAAGCTLWDLAASPRYATFLVDSLAPSVATAALDAALASGRWRLAEVCLGLTANLASHAPLRGRVAGTQGLQRAALRGALEGASDAGLLSEAARLAAACVGEWAEALGDGELLGRLLWMADNTLNAQLLERSFRLLAAIATTRPDSCRLLLQLGAAQAVAGALRQHVRAMQRGASPASPRSARLTNRGASPASPQSGRAADGGGWDSDADSEAAAGEAGGGGGGGAADAAAAAVAAQLLGFTSSLAPSGAAVEEALRLVEALAADPLAQAALSQQEGLVGAVAATLAWCGAGASSLLESALIAAALLQDGSAAAIARNPRFLVQLLRMWPDVDDAARGAYLSVLAAALHHVARSQDTDLIAGAGGALTSGGADCILDVGRRCLCGGGADEVSTARCALQATCVILSSWLAAGAAGSPAQGTAVALQQELERLL